MTGNDKDLVKQSLSIEQVEDLVAELGGEPIARSGCLVCKTICHGGESHKLYYYDNTKLFRCFTECDDTFDIYQLILKIKRLEGQKVGYYSASGEYVERDWELPDAIKYVAKYFSIELQQDNNLEVVKSPDWQIFERYEKNEDIDIEVADVQLPEYDGHFLQHFPQPHIDPWEREGITYETEKRFGIRYNPVAGTIIIPHYDKDNRLIGIRERTLIKENEKYGKYRPAYLRKTVYKHPLSFNLYNLNNSKANIARSGLAIVGEGEKFCMMYSSLFGAENDISVACCGSSLIGYQFKLLMEAGAKEVVIAFDKQFQEVNDDEWKRWVKKLKQINTKYGALVRISYMFDKEGRLGYKESPIDPGKETFLYLFQNRFSL